MPYKDPAKRKEYLEKNKEKHGEYQDKYYEKNQEQIKEKKKEYYDDKKQHAYDSITSERIIDQQKWDLWCNNIKRWADKKKHPYSDEFTNDVIFDLMTRGCYYCGDVATTIDRLNSDLNHTIENCVASCLGCNVSKGTADPSTFIRKSYYRAHGKYVDDVTDVWHENKVKPRICDYKQRATKQGVSFDLSKEKWNSMIADDCYYCHRSPTTWFGVDRVVPSLGYVSDNVVTCCYDCNLDKHKYDVKMTMARNERIAKRVNAGDLAADNQHRTILHQGNRKSSKCMCIHDDKYPDVHLIKNIL
jgi:hypothetical protein